jgi:O-antigen/teichoic acid export membrane protein
VSSLDDALGGLAESAAVVFVGLVVGRLLSLLGQVLIARTLGPTAFGHVALAYTVVTMVGTLALLGTHEGVTRQMSASDTAGERRRLLRSGYAMALVGACLVAILVYLARFEIASALNDERLPGLLIPFLPFLVANATARVSFGALRSFGRSVAAAVARDLGPRVVALAVFGLFVVAGEPVSGAVAYWVVVPVVMTVLAIAYLHQELATHRILGGLPDAETTRSLWSFSWPLAVGASFFLLLSNVDVLMIAYFLDPRSVGLYRAIQPLRQVTTFVLTAFTFLFLPLATEYYDRGNFAALDRLYTVSTKWAVVVTVPPVLVFTLFAPEVVRAFFGAAYVPAAPALAVLTAGLFVRALVGLNGDVTKAIDRPRIELYSVAIAVVVDIALNAALIPRYGIVGAAFATAVGYAVYNLLEVGAIYRAVGSHPFAANTLKPLVPTMLVGVGIERLTAGIAPSLVLLVGIGVTLAVVHLGALVLTNSLDEADLILFERVEERTGIDFRRVKSLFWKQG